MFVEDTTTSQNGVKKQGYSKEPLTNPFLKAIDASLSEYNKRTEHLLKMKTNQLKFEQEENMRRQEMEMKRIEEKIQLKKRIEEDNYIYKEQERQQELEATIRRRERAIEREKRVQEEFERKKIMEVKEKERQLALEKELSLKQQADSSNSSNDQIVTREIRCNSREILKRRDDRARLQAEREERERKYREEEKQREIEREIKRNERMEERERRHSKLESLSFSYSPEKNYRSSSSLPTSYSPLDRIKDKTGVNRPVRYARGSASAIQSRERRFKCDSI